MHRAGALTASIHGEPNDPPAASAVAVLRDRVGRIIWNGYPTGVAVSWAMHHGGPWPSAVDPRETSVGAGAIARFLRPVADTLRGVRAILLASWAD